MAEEASIQVLVVALWRAGLWTMQEIGNTKKHLITGEDKHV
jgi:hypothetical protein